jgi:uncharacterized protein (DUF433 family)
MTDLAEKMDHPYIVSHKDYCGGSPIIKGTKFPVRSVANYVLRQGISPKEIVGEFSHLTLAQVYDALFITTITRKSLTASCGTTNQADPLLSGQAFG